MRPTIHNKGQQNGPSMNDVRDRNGAGVFIPVLHGFVLSHPRPIPHDGENFLTPSPPLGAPRSLAPPRKTLLFVNLPYN